MLGNTVVRHFRSRDDYEITATYRTDGLMEGVRAICFDVLSDSLDKLPSDFDYVLNCIGICKPFMAQSIQAAIKINSLFPWQLSDWCDKTDTRLIHITTDCVYSGLKGKYVESDLHDALDDYGKSKSLGETTNAMVLRTSIIGEEVHKDAFLIAWIKSQKGKTVNGFSTHLWNGITTNEYARICDDIIMRDLYKKDLFHVFAKDDVTKLDMMHYFNEKYNLELTIEDKRVEPCDRTMRTSKDLCAKLNVPTVRDMIMAID